MGKILIIAGLLLVVAGIIVQFIQPGGIPRLPGDIYIKREGFSFYFPLGWCILISVVLTVFFRLFGK